MVKQNLRLHLMGTDNTIPYGRSDKRVKREYIFIMIITAAEQLKACNNDSDFRFDGGKNQNRVKYWVAKIQLLKR